MKFYKNLEKQKGSPGTQYSKTKDLNEEELMLDLKDNINKIEIALGQSTDIVTRQFYIDEDEKIKVGVIYTDGLVDKALVQEIVIKTLMVDFKLSNFYSIDTKNTFQILKDFVITAGDVKEINTFKTLYTHMLSGDTIILIHGYKKGFAVSLRGGENREVREPSSQTVVRGPKDGFTETLRTNTALIRRKIKSPNLWIETKPIGRETMTDVAIMYIKDIANEKIIEEVRGRLNKIDIDGILESGYIEEFIQDEIYSPFPTVINTERPDSVAAGLLEGRIAILVDGTPFVLLVPALFIDFFQSSEDYYMRFDISSLIRLIRYISFFLALFVPSLYIAVVTFHQEMLPPSLLMSIAAQKEGVPFPTVIEVVIMEITFEILREAGIRMPRAIGSAISIVGALVLGESAVNAGIISPAMVIIVSITAISSFVLPTFIMNTSVRMLRFIFMILGATFGLYGIILGVIAMILHLCSIRSFGIPYMTPIGPFINDDQSDFIFRAPHWKMHSRPRLINQKNIIRENTTGPTKPQSKNDTQEK